MAATIYMAQLLDITSPNIAKPSGKQVLVKITHSGVCGTDEHYKTADMVLGHKGIGTVEAVDGSIKTLAVRDRVG
ncbi:hypothetical protein CDV36_001878 [Fusarium kuroshium]|uniref:Alcohol dehydrogenase-like N-terminal domain-containing protein n=1 Tax=Fusarium kuroshium TaxID=2010991 RepID=A0A3M2SLK1_9HYPO|nr:hypothetical protein CDV36_001878 [Fusarium kuroshium]